MWVWLDCTHKTMLNYGAMLAFGEAHVGAVYVSDTRRGDVALHKP